VLILHLSVFAERTIPPPSQWWTWEDALCAITDELWREGVERARAALTAGDKAAVDKFKRALPGQIE